MGEAPLGSVVFRRHTVRRHQVALEHFQLFAVFEADQVFIRDGFFDWNGGRQLDWDVARVIRQSAEFRKGRLDQIRYRGIFNGVVRDF